jgi:hypothetical protein
MTAFKKYRILYSFHHSRMGFENSLTVEALNVDQAIEKVRAEVAGAYGSRMLKRFSFKPDPYMNGAAIR